MKEFAPFGSKLFPIRVVSTSEAMLGDFFFSIFYPVCA